MFAAIQAPLFFGLIAAFVTTVGLLAVAQRGDWSARHAGLFAVAAGGMLVTLTLLHIMPEATAKGGESRLFLLGGFLGGVLIHYAVRGLFGEASQNGRAAALTPVLAIGLHSFIDGVIYSVTFAASFSAGVYAAMALILHEFPEGIIAFAILRGAGVSNRLSFLWAFLAAAATTPLGVIASAPVMYGLGEAWLGNLFAVSAGLLLFVATGPLLAPLREEPALRSFAALGVGVIAAGLLSLSPIHRHEHGTHDHGHDHPPAFAPIHRY